MYCMRGLICFVHHLLYVWDEVVVNLEKFPDRDWRCFIPNVLILLQPCKSLCWVVPWSVTISRADSVVAKRLSWWKQTCFLVLVPLNNTWRVPALGGPKTVKNGQFVQPSTSFFNEFVVAASTFSTCDRWKTCATLLFYTIGGYWTGRKSNASSALKIVWARH